MRPNRIMAMAMLSLLLLSAAITVTPGGGVRAFEKARDAIRASGEHGTILIRAGDYFVDHTIGLDARDPGSVYQAEPGVRWIRSIRLGEWRPVKDGGVLSRLTPAARNHVVDHKVPKRGGLQARGFGRAHIPSHLELFFQGQRMTVARWPNGEFARIEESLDANAPDEGHGKKLGRLPFGFR